MAVAYFWITICFLLGNIQTIRGEETDQASLLENRINAIEANRVRDVNFLLGELSRMKNEHSHDISELKNNHSLQMEKLYRKVHQNKGEITNSTENVSVVGK